MAKALTRAEPKTVAMRHVTLLKLSDLRKLTWLYVNSRRLLKLAFFVDGREFEFYCRATQIWCALDERQKRNDLANFSLNTTISFLAKAHL